jgi:hypothetical protein
VTTTRRIAITLDAATEAISWVATTGGIDNSDIRDLMIECVESSLRAGRQISPADRAAVGQRLALYRR